MSSTYKIGEAAALLNLKTCVLRFWETEFAQITPLRTEKGQRLYTGEHLALLRRIRHLLHERGLTIEGARRLLAEEAARSAAGGGSGGTPASLPLFGPYGDEPGSGPEDFSDEREDGLFPGRDLPAPALAGFEPGGSDAPQTLSPRPPDGPGREEARALRGLFNDLRDELEALADDLRRPPGRP